MSVAPGLMPAATAGPAEELAPPPPALPGVAEVAPAPVPAPVLPAAPPVGAPARVPAAAVPLLEAAATRVAEPLPLRTAVGPLAAVTAPAAGAAAPASAAVPVAEAGAPSEAAAIWSVVIDVPPALSAAVPTWPAAPKASSRRRAWLPAQAEANNTTSAPRTIGLRTRTRSRFMLLPPAQGDPHPAQAARAASSPGRECFTWPGARQGPS